MIRPHSFFLYLCIWASSLIALEPSYILDVPMRDGSELPISIYLPDPEARDLPCVLYRKPSSYPTPYLEIESLLKSKIAVAVQDLRPIGSSNHAQLPFQSDGWGLLQDGYDTIEWLAESPYTNGKIGTAGASAVGITQFLLAPTAPPHLFAQYIINAPASLWKYAVMDGGQIKKDQVEGWLSSLWSGPVREQLLDQLKAELFNPDFWKQYNSLSYASKFKAPILHVTGWYDIFLQGTLDAFSDISKSAPAYVKSNQKLIIGPWHHWYPLKMQFGDFSMPEEAVHFPYELSQVQWFTHYLKDIDVGLDQYAPVTYFVMGSFDSDGRGNYWQSANEWPPYCDYLPLFIYEDKLQPIIEHELDHVAFKYSLNNPVPSVGGRTLFIEPGPKDQSEIEKRDDVLTFTSAPLTNDIEVVGRILAKLFVSSDHPDGDIAIRLTDVYPDGRSILIAEGLTRLSSSQEWLHRAEEDLIVEIPVDLWSTGMLFNKGHRIRISISGTNYPEYEMTTFSSSKEAQSTIKIFSGWSTPSRIELPVTEIKSVDDIEKGSEEPLAKQVQDLQEPVSFDWLE